MSDPNELARIKRRINWLRDEEVILSTFYECEPSAEVKAECHIMLIGVREEINKLIKRKYQLLGKSR